MLFGQIPLDPLIPWLQRAFASGEVTGYGTLDYGFAADENERSRSSTLSPSIDIPAQGGKRIQSVRVLQDGVDTGITIPGAIGQSSWSSSISTTGEEVNVTSTGNSDTDAYFAWYRYSSSSPDKRWNGDLGDRSGNSTKVYCASTETEDIGGVAMPTFPGCSYTLNSMSHRDKDFKDSSAVPVGSAFVTVTGFPTLNIVPGESIDGPELTSGTSESEFSTNRVYDTSVIPVDSNNNDDFWIEYTQDFFDYPNDKSPPNPAYKELDLPGARLMVYFAKFSFDIAGITYQHPDTVEIVYEDEDSANSSITITGASEVCTNATLQLSATLVYNGTPQSMQFDPHLIWSSSALASISSSGLVSAGGITGSVTISAHYVDTGQGIDEADTATVTVKDCSGGGPKPNLVPSALSGPGCIAIGSTPAITYKVKNLGVTTNETFRISLNRNGSEVAFQILYGLNSNQEKTFTYNGYTFTSMVGQSFSLVVDSVNNIDESDESNTINQVFAPQSSCGGGPPEGGSVSGDFSFPKGGTIAWGEAPYIQTTSISVTGACNYVSHKFIIRQDLNGYTTADHSDPDYLEVVTYDVSARAYNGNIRAGTVSVTMEIRSDCGIFGTAGPKTFEILSPPSAAPSITVSWMKGGLPVTEAIQGDILSLKVISMSDPDGDPTTVQWDFSEHAWTNALPGKYGWTTPYNKLQYNGIAADQSGGSFRVCATAIDSWGKVSPPSSDSCADLYVTGPEPIPVITGASLVKEGRTIIPPLSADSSYSPVPGRSIDHSRDEWTNQATWNDGTSQTWWGLAASYLNPGTVRQYLDVYDSTGLKSAAAASHTTTVIPDQPPVISFEYISTFTRSTRSFKNTSYSADGDVIGQYQVSYGYDGGNNGMCNPDTVLSYDNGYFSFTPPAVGNYCFRVYAKEASGGYEREASQIYMVSVINDNPDVTFAVKGTVSEPMPVTVTSIPPSAFLQSAWVNTSVSNPNYPKKWGIDPATGNLTNTGLRPKMTAPNLTALTVVGTKQDYCCYGAIGGDNDTHFSGKGSALGGYLDYSGQGQYFDLAGNKFTIGNSGGYFTLVKQDANNQVLWQMPLESTEPYCETPDDYEICYDPTIQLSNVMFPDDNQVGVVNYRYFTYIYNGGGSKTFRNSDGANISYTILDPTFMDEEISTNGYEIIASSYAGNDSDSVIQIIDPKTHIVVQQYNWTEDARRTAGGSANEKYYLHNFLYMGDAAYKLSFCIRQNNRCFEKGYLMISGPPLASNDPVMYGQLINPSMNVANGTLTYSMKLPSDKKNEAVDTAGMSFRIQNHQNMYRLHSGMNRLSLVKMVNGGETEMGAVTRPLSLDVFHAYKIMYSGTHLKVYEDGTLVIDVYDGQFSSGSLGPFSIANHVQFKNVSVLQNQASVSSFVNGAVLVDEAAAYDKTYADPENDPAFPPWTQWHYEHVDPWMFLDWGSADGYKYGISSLHGATVSSEQLAFNKVGKYKIDYRVPDDPHPWHLMSNGDYMFQSFSKYSDWYTQYLIVHRKPIALAAVTPQGSGIVSWNDQSFDPDHCYARNNCQAAYANNGGIFGAKYYYITPGGSRVDGKLTNPLETGTYTVALAVRDEYGAWSDWYETEVLIWTPAPPNNPPAAALTFPTGTFGAPTAVTLQPTISWNMWDADAGTVFTTFNLTIKDQWGNCYECVTNQIMNAAAGSWAWTVDVPLQMGGMYQVQVQVSDGESWSSWSNIGWMITNRAPEAYMSSPWGTQANPTLFTTTQPTLSWSQTDVDPGTIFTHYELDIRYADYSYVYGSEVQRTQWTSGAAGIWSMAAEGVHLPVNVPLQVRVRVSDGSAWSAWSAYVWMVVNRPPSAAVTWPAGTQVSPTVSPTLRPALVWSQSDPDPGAVFTYAQLQIHNEANTVTVFDSGLLFQNTGSGSGTYALTLDLPAGQKLRVKVKVWDQYGAESAWSPEGWLSTNQSPSGTITIPSPIYEHDTPSFTVFSSDPDGDMLSVIVESSYNGGAFDTIRQWSGLVSGQQQSFTYGPLVQGTYLFRLTVQDNHGGLFQNNYSFPVLPLGLTGQVNHTAEWEGYRQTWNVNHPQDQRAAGDFWAGEAFVLSAEVTNTGSSPTKPLSVTAQLISTGESSILGTADGVHFNGMLVNPDHIHTLQMGVQTFRFTVVWSNGYSQSYDVPVTIKGTIYDVIIGHLRL